MMTALGRRLPARYALPLGFGALLCLLVAVTLLGLTRMNAMQARLQSIVDAQHVKTGIVSGMLPNIRERSQIMRESLASPRAVGSGERNRRYEALKAEYERLGARWEGMAASDAERRAMQAALSAHDALLATHRQIQENYARDPDRAAYLFGADAAEQQAAAEEKLYAVLEVIGTTALAVVDEASAATRSSLLLIAVVGVLLLAMGGAIAIAITRRVTRTESELELEKELAQVTLHSIGDGVVTTDADGHVEYLNPIAEKYTGWSSREARGRPLAEIYRVVDERTGVELDPFAKEAAPKPGDDAAVAVRLVHRDGRACPVRYSHAPIRGRDGRPLGMILVFHDISQIRAMAQQLIWQASHDALTGLVNRREFERRLNELIENARTQGRPHVLLYMDLDNFKAVNDTCGHVAGDELLRQLTAVMLSRMRGSDTLARLGGDEFGVLLESCPLEQAVRIANAVRETVREFRFVWENKTFSVGLSIGIVPIGADSGNMNTLLSRADACCYEAKNRGRDRVQVYRPETHDGAGRNGELQLVSNINRAFEAGRFRLYRQAIVPLHGACGGQRYYEILVRMEDESGALLPPTAFMPAAERYNLLTSIERWVISSLLEQLHCAWRAGEVPAHPAACGYYAVNLSGASVNDKSFPDFLRNLLTRYELPPGLLCFEITETTAIANLNKAAELMHEFKGLGCRFSLDDFGTGMSSFAYLKYLPVDTLKIAGMFVKDMANDPMDAAIVEAINRISHILGMHTVAESVEDAATLDAVSRLGIDFAQGYHIAEPEALVPVPSHEPAPMPT